MVTEEAQIFDFQEAVFNKRLKEEVETSLQPIMGDMIVGELTENLIKEFCEVTELYWRLDEFADIMKDRIANNSTKFVRASMDMATPDELLTLAQEVRAFETDKEAYDYFKYVATYEAKHKNLVLSVRSHIDNFTHHYDIRQGFKIVRLEKKYSI